MSPDFHFAYGSQSIVAHISDFGSVYVHCPMDQHKQQHINQLQPETSYHPLSVNYYPSLKPLSISDITEQDGEEFSPFGIAAAPNGNIIVTDIENHHIHIFDPNIKWLSAFGELGDGDGKFNRPTGVAMMSTGDIVVADQLNNRVQVFNGVGHFEYQFGEKGDDLGQMLYPCGLAIDSADKIYICDSGNFRIQVCKPNGKPLYVFGDRDQFIHQPHFIAVTIDARILISDSKQYIRVFKGSHEMYKLYMSQPTGLAVDDLGNIIVGHSAGHIVILRDTGEALCHIGTCGKRPGQFILPRAITITQQGNIVVADSAANRIQMFRVNMTQHSTNTIV
jgi:DNA-binding beta-propeller fold protein YncE